MFGLSHPKNCDSAPLHRPSWAPLSTAPQNLQGWIQWRKRRHNSLCFGPQGSVSHLDSPPNTPVALLSSIMKHNYPYLATSVELLCVWLGVRAPAPDWLNTSLRYQPTTLSDPGMWSSHGCGCAHCSRLKNLHCVKLRCIFLPLYSHLDNVFKQQSASGH